MEWYVEVICNLNNWEIEYYVSLLNVLASMFLNEACGI